MQHLIYLHGFLSSPQSEKAQQTLAFAKKHYPYLNVHTPQLAGNIQQAVKQVDTLVRSLPKGNLRFIGSSMGGYLSTYVCEKYGGKAVLINPAVRPFDLLSGYIGLHINPYTGEKFSIHSGHIACLRSLYCTSLKQGSAYKVLLQTGDETLDYRLAEAKYTGADITVEQGGDHSFIAYENHLASIFSFLR